MFRVDILAWAALTKCHRLVGLSNRYLFLIVLATVKSKIRVLVWLSSDENPLGLQIDAFFLYPYMMEKRELTSPLLPLIRSRIL